MKYTLVLNGCAKTFHTLAEEVNGFINANLPACGAGKTIIFYADEAEKDDLIKFSPTRQLVLLKMKRYYPEAALELLCALEKEQPADLYLFPGSYSGSELSVRLASRMQGSSLVDVLGIDQADDWQPGKELIFRKAVYNNYMQAEFALRKKPFCISPARGAAEPVPVQALKKEELQVDEPDLKNVEQVAENNSGIVSYNFTETETTAGLEEASFILAAGRGVKNAAGLEKAKAAADAIGAEFGVSRPVVMQAWAPLKSLIGVSGAITKPDLCIAAGVSGAAAFYAGIEKSKYIIAINTDPGAPIIRASDLAVIDDYEKIFDELVRLVKEDN